MKLSVPVYSLKRLAKELARDKKVPLHAALNRVAQEEGFASWGLLAARLSAESPACKLFDRLAPGDLVLLGARPIHGKTVMGLELAVKAVESGRCAWFFTLGWNMSDLLNALRILGKDLQLSMKDSASTTPMRSVQATSSIGLLLQQAAPSWSSTTFSCWTKNERT